MMMMRYYIEFMSWLKVKIKYIIEIGKIYRDDVRKGIHEYRDEIM
jgi:hypothetical protein